MNIPSNLKYSRDHEWVLVEGNQAIVGITNYAQEQLGEIVYVDVQTQGETLGAHEVFGSLEAVKTVSDLLLPVSGEITAFNDDLDENPDLINKDPYGEGWIVRVNIANPEDLNSLLSAEEYQVLIGK